MPLTQASRGFRVRPSPSTNEDDTVTFVFQRGRHSFFEHSIHIPSPFIHSSFLPICIHSFTHSIPNLLVVSQEPTCAFAVCARVRQACKWSRQRALSVVCCGPCDHILVLRVEFRGVELRKRGAAGRHTPTERVNHLAGTSPPQTALGAHPRIPGDPLHPLQSVQAPHREQLWVSGAVKTRKTLRLSASRKLIETNVTHLADELASTKRLDNNSARPSEPLARNSTSSRTSNGTVTVSKNHGGTQSHKQPPRKCVRNTNTKEATTRSPEERHARHQQWAPELPRKQPENRNQALARDSRSQRRVRANGTSPRRRRRSPKRTPRIPGHA